MVLRASLRRPPAVGRLVRTNMYPIVGVMSVATTESKTDSAKDIKSGNSALGSALKTSMKLANVFSGAADDVMKLGLGSIKAAAGIEQMNASFTTLLGSTSQASEFVGELQQFAATTPLEFTGVADASQQMLACGFSAQQIIPALAAVGDATAGLGLGAESVNDVTSALSQMQMSGRISGAEMAQLTAEGIPAWQYLADTIGVDVPQAMQMAQAGAIAAGPAIAGMLQGMEAQYGGAMQTQSQTLIGMWENAKESIGQIMGSIGQGIINAFDLKGKLSGALEWLTSFATALREGGIREALDQLVPPGVQVAILAIAGAIAGALLPALGSMIGSLARMALAAAQALIPLLPYIAIGAAIAAAAYLIYKAWDPLGAWFGALWSVVGAAFRIGGAGINVVLNEIRLGLANFLNYALDKVATLGEGLGTIISKIPIIGGLGDKLLGASLSLRDWVTGFRDIAAAKLDAAKGSLNAAQQEYGSAVDAMGKAGSDIAAAFSSAVADGVNSSKDLFGGLKGPAAAAGNDIATGLRPATDAVTGLNAGLAGVGSQLSNLSNANAGSTGGPASNTTTPITLPPDSTGHAYENLLNGLKESLGGDEAYREYVGIYADLAGISGEGAWAAADQNLINMWEKGGYKLIDGLPQLGAGGIVTGPTLALLGERHRPEAVIPLDRIGSGATDGMTVVIEMDGREMARTVLPYMPGEIRRVGVRPA